MLKRLFAITLGIAVILSMSGASHAFKDDIVAAWLMDEGSGAVIHDASGNNNDGDLIGGADWVDGQFGKAINFDGSSGHIEVPFHDSIDVINKGDFTLVAWFMADEAPAENKEVFQQGDATGRTWLFISPEGSEIRSWLGAGGTYSGVGAEAGQWYHAALVVNENGNSDNIQIYVNGEPSGDPFNVGVEDAKGSYFIGCHKDLTNFWDGVIDEVMLVSKALSQAEIESLVSEGIAGIMAVEPASKLTVNWGSLKND